MINGLRVVAVITARGGSKGLPGKNVRPLAGKPLVAWSVDHALAVREIDRVILSSDDPEIIAAAVTAGCEAPFVRPAELSLDTTPSAPVVIHALDAVGETAGLVVLLQPTSPLRLPDDIRACLAACAAGAPSCVTVTEPAKSPYWMYRMDECGRLSPLLDGARAARRQDLPKVWCPNGAVYAARIDWLRHHQRFIAEATTGVPMPAGRSVDIDTLWDFRLAEMMLGGD